jgi:chromosome segregation ATPase
LCDSLRAEQAHSSRLQAELSRQKQRAEAAEQDNAALHHQLDESHTQLSQLKVDLGGVRSEADSAKSRAEGLERDKAALQDELEKREVRDTDRGEEERSQFRVSSTLNPKPKPRRKQRAQVTDKDQGPCCNSSPKEPDPRPPPG